MTYINKLYSRKTFTVEAIQVTDQNMRALADWCGGRVTIYFPDQSEGYRSGQTCVEVVVGNVNGRVQKARAYHGDWVTCLVGTKNFKVYKNKSFREAFEEVRSEQEKREEVMKVMERALTISGSDLDFMIDNFTGKIMEIFN